MRKHFLWLGLSIVLLALGAGAAFAQDAQIFGTVRDQTGGVVPGVTMTAQNQQTGLQRTAVADYTGTYRLRALPPGTYTLVAELPGFRVERRTDIVLMIDQTATLNFIVEPAGVEETITVIGESPLVDLTKSEVSSSISGLQISELPVATRRWVDLVLLTPGTTQDGIRGRAYRGNVNIGGGARFYSNLVLVDGVNMNYAEMGEPRQNFGMDAISEVKVINTGYKAEYGLATGGVLSVVTKTGTNAVKGSAFVFYRDDALTATEFFQSEKPPYSRYQFGGAIGGPIKNDRAHFFFQYERTEEDLYTTVFYGGIWPDFEGTFLADRFQELYMPRIDVQLSSTQTLFVRYAKEEDWKPLVNIGGPINATSAYDNDNIAHSAVVGHTWIVSEKALNDFRFQYGWTKYSLGQAGYSERHDRSGWAPGDLDNQERLQDLDPVFRHPSTRIGSSTHEMGVEQRWEFRNDFSYFVSDWGGQHQLKTGIDYNYIPFEDDALYSFSGNWTFPKDEPFNPNDPTTFPTRYTDSRPRYASTPTTHISAYVQDDWSPTQNLTLNLGLRYDVQLGSFNEDLDAQFDRVEEVLGPGFRPTIPIPFLESDPISGSGFDQRGDHNNFGPRIGFAWDPTGEGKTVVRGAWGLYYENIRTLTMLYGEIRWPQAKPVSIDDPSFPDPFQGRSRDEFLSTAPPNIRVLSNDLVNPYSYHLATGVSHQLAPSVALDVDFIWTEGRDDRDRININVPDEVTSQRPYPQFGRVRFSQSTADRSYRALLVKLSRRFSGRWQALVGYTLSKSEQNLISSADPTVWGFSRLTGPDATDRRHRLTLSGIAMLPYGIQVSAIGDFKTALPFNPASSSDLNGDRENSDLPPGVGFFSGNRDLNIDAINTFRASVGLAPVSADDIDSPGYANVDLRLIKSFPFATSAQLDLILQVLNVFNGTHLDRPVSNPGSTIFGQSTNITRYIVNAPSRQIELGFRVQF